MHINLKISRYQDRNRAPQPHEVGYAASFELEGDSSWIGFVDRENRPVLFVNRDPETGAILPHNPEAQAKALELLRAEQARRVAWTEPVSGVYYPVFAGEMFIGRTCPPAPRQPVGLSSPSDCDMNGVFLESFIPT